MKKLNITLLLFTAIAVFNFGYAQPSPAWQKNIYLTQTDTKATEVRPDGAGNIYMTSTSAGGGGRIDIQKYSSTGNLIWTNRLTGYLTTCQYQTAVDASGNFFITYYNNYDDLIVNKIDSNNIIAWTYTYTDLGTGAFPDCISVGADGNVYVSGYTYNATFSNQRSLIVKIDAGGNQVWEALFDLNGSNQDEMYSVRADINGDVWATGYGYKNAVQGYNIVTLKYNSAGVFQWSKEINGTLNGTDQGWFIIPDNFGNAYELCDIATSGQSQNVYTIKYDGSGNTVWSNEYNGSSNSLDYIEDVTLDNAGNLLSVATGNSATNANNIVTRKFTPSGTILWTNEYNTTEGGFNNEFGSSIITDTSGNIYVTGLDQTHTGPTGFNSTTLIKYASDGTQLFAILTSASGINAEQSWSMGINTDGNIVFTDSEVKTPKEANLRAYSNSGTFIFDKTYKADAYATEQIKDLQADNSGNVYAAIYDGTYQPWFVKYDNAGNELWRTHYSGNNYILESVQGSSCLDVDGNFYVVGDRAQASGYTAMAVSKISPAGVILWTATYNAPGTGNDFAYAVTVDTTGNVYITGRGYESAAKGDNIYTVKFNSSGVMQWASKIEGIHSGAEAGNALATDNLGNVYVTGKMAGAVFNDNDIFISKINSTGVNLWVKKYNGSATTELDSEQGFDIKLDSSLNIYACGSIQNQIGDLGDFFVTKLDNSGNELWTYTKDGDGNYDDAPSNLVIKNNNVYIAGYLYNAGGYDSYLCALDYSGNVLLQKTLDNTDPYYDWVIAMRIDYVGNIICVGPGLYTTTGQTEIRKFNQNGDLLWTNDYSNNYLEENWLLSITENGGIYVGDNLTNTYTGIDARITKICDPAIPLITPDNSTTFCEGNSINLSATTATSWIWNTGAITSEINVNTSGNYFVTNTFQNGCSSMSASTIVTVNPNPVNTVSASGPTTFCDGGSVTLTADENGASYLWSNGATTQAINVTTSDNYSVTITNVNGCSSLSANIPVTVNSNPINTVSVSGPTAFCVGGSVTLTADEIDANYLWSNGATTQLINATTTGDYTVTITNAIGCSVTSAIVPVIVNSNPVATITPSGPTTFCEGSNVVLDAGAGFTSYLWNNGATTQFIIVNTNGNYNVTVTNASGCSSTSTNTMVTVNPTPTISISGGGATTFCQGGNVILTASYAGGTILQWKKNGVNITGATTASYTVNQSGNYSCTITGTCGNVTSNIITVTVNKNPKAGITATGSTTFCAGGSVLLTELAGAGQTYQWYKGNMVIAGATTTTYTATTAGNYKCRVTKTVTGCFKTSNSIVVTVPCKESEIAEDDIHIYPNPTSGIFSIDMNRITDAPVQIKVFDMLGNSIKTAAPTTESTVINLDISEQPAGIYLIIIEQNGLLKTERIVKQ